VNAAADELHVSVKSRDERVVGRAFSSAATELAVATSRGVRRYAAASEASISMTILESDSLTFVTPNTQS